VWSLQPELRPSNHLFLALRLDEPRERDHLLRSSWGVGELTDAPQKPADIMLTDTGGNTIVSNGVGK